MADVSRFPQGSKLPAGALVGAKTMLLEESGGTYTLAQSSTYLITLPTAAAANTGVSYKFFMIANGAFTITISDGAANMIGTIVNDVTSVLPATGTTLTFVSGTAAIGDNVEVTSNGISWLVRAVSSVNGGITIT